MGKTAPRFQKTGTSISTADLERHAQDWLLDGQIRQLSKRTLEARSFLVQKLVWFLKQREAATCGTPELRGFLAYLSTGHTTGNGRWDNPQMTRGVRPRTIQTYHGNLKTFFRFLV